MKLLERPPPVRDEPRRSPEVIIPEARRRERWRRTRIVLSVVLVLAVAGTVGAFLGTGGAPTPNLLPAFPKNLPAVVVKAISHTTLLLWPAGPVPITTPVVGNASSPNVRAVLAEDLGSGHLSMRVLPRTEDGVVKLSLLVVGRYLVYEATGGVWALARNFKGRVRLLGQATGFVPSEASDQVWLVHTGYGVQTASVSNGGLGPVVALPQGTSIVEGTAEGLLLVSRGRGDFELWRPGGAPRVVANLGTDPEAVFASDAQMFAFGAGCRYAKATPGNYEYTVCRTLRVVDLATGRRLSFQAPPGTVGWVPNSTTNDGLAPGGARLAARAAASPARTARSEEFVVTLSERRHTVTRVPSWNGTLYVRAAAWSPGGSLLFYQGPHGRLDVFYPANDSRYQSKVICCQGASTMLAVHRTR